MTTSMSNSKSEHHMTASSQYQQVSYGNAPGAHVTMKIRNPKPSDVLCGRGGGINAHEGNIAFRELVQDQKEQYNLAANKNEKAEISQEIVDHVTNRGGRFLQRDESQPFSNSAGKNTGWWMGIDNIKAIAKTSQALREGAPRIRATAAKTKPKKSAQKRSRKSTASAQARPSNYSSPAQENVDPIEEDLVDPHPLIRGYHDGIHRGKQLIPVAPPAKKARIEKPDLEPMPYPENVPTPPPEGKPNGQGEMRTPTLLSTSHPTNEVEKFSLPQHVAAAKINQVSEDAESRHSPQPATLTIMDPASSSFADLTLTKPEKSCARLHSMSEISNTDDFCGDESFANPFENEERLLKQQEALAASRNELDSSDPSISFINKILRSKSSDLSGKKQLVGETSAPRPKTTLRREQSLR